MDDDSTVVLDDDTASDDDSSTWTAEVHSLDGEATAVFEMYWPTYDVEGLTLFGYDVALDGDINGDGYDDVLVKAPGDWYIQEYFDSWVSRYYIYFGPKAGAFSSEDADICILAGANTSQSGLGYADLNGDGMDDLYFEWGSLIVYFGPLEAGTYNAYDESGKWDVKIDLSPAIEDSVVAGDLNGDGYPDLALLTSYPSSTLSILDGPLGEGVDGEIDGEEAARSTWTNDGPGAVYPSVVAAPGDIDGDGLADLLVGDSLYGDGIGAVYALYGPIEDGVHSLADADARFVGDELGSNVGYQISPAGDLDEDGLDDFMINNRYMSFSLVYGTITRLSGEILVSSFPDHITFDAASITDLGFTMARSSLGTRGDLNGDGLNDMVIGAEYSDGKYPRYGGVSIASGPIYGDISPSDLDELWLSDLAGCYPPEAVSTGGDVDADGSPDFLVGCPYNGYYASGVVYLVSGAL